MLKKFLLWILAKAKVFGARALKVAGTILKQLWASISDGEWDLDVYRLGGVAAYVVAGILALKVAGLALIVDSTKLGILAGLVTALGTIGTTLFAQARKNDASLAAPPAPRGP